MKTGLLWYDSDPSATLAEKVARAAACYRHKHGRPPNHCFVHPSLLEGDPRQLDGVRVEPLRTVLPHHFWIGEEEEHGGCVERG